VHRSMVKISLPIMYACVCMGSYRGSGGIAPPVVNVSVDGGEQ
jgi:hypothetical protein